MQSHLPLRVLIRAIMQNLCSIILNSPEEVAGNIYKSEKHSSIGSQHHNNLIDRIGEAESYKCKIGED